MTNIPANHFRGVVTSATINNMVGVEEVSILRDKLTDHRKPCRSDAENRRSKALNHRYPHGVLAQVPGLLALLAEMPDGEVTRIYNRATVDMDKLRSEHFIHRIYVKPYCSPVRGKKGSEWVVEFLMENTNFNEINLEQAPREKGPSQRVPVNLSELTHDQTMKMAEHLLSIFWNRPKWMNGKINYDHLPRTYHVRKQLVKTGDEKKVTEGEVTEMIADALLSKKEVVLSFDLIHLVEPDNGGTTFIEAKSPRT